MREAVDDLGRTEKDHECAGEVVAGKKDDESSEDLDLPVTAVDDELDERVVPHVGNSAKDDGDLGVHDGLGAVGGFTAKRDAINLEVGRDEARLAEILENTELLAVIFFSHLVVRVIDGPTKDDATGGKEGEDANDDTGDETSLSHARSK